MRERSKLAHCASRGARHGESREGLLLEFELGSERTQAVDLEHAARPILTLAAAAACSNALSTKCVAAAMAEGVQCWVDAGEGRRGGVLEFGARGTMPSDEGRLVHTRIVRGVRVGL